MNNPVEKSCPHCGKSVILPYKKRDRPGYCSTTCAYADRVIYPKDKTCQQCGERFSVKGDRKYCSPRCASAAYVGFRHSDKSKALMSERWTTERRDAATIPLVQRHCLECDSVFDVKESGKGSEKLYCSPDCYTAHLATNNHMKSPEMRQRMSEVAQNRSPETNRKIGEGVSKAWARGDFEGVRVGQCDWFAYPHGGKVYKVQGAWELAFIHWMCQNGLRFSCHRGRVSYADGNGVERSWYPDFFVYDWDGWVDVKCDHFYQPEKFDAIQRANPGITLYVLLQNDLENLGVPIYGPGNKYMPYLQELVDTCRVGSKKSEDLANLITSFWQGKVEGGAKMCLAALERNEYDRKKGV